MLMQLTTLLLHVAWTIVFYMKRELGRWVKESFTWMFRLVSCDMIVCVNYPMALE